MKLSKITPLFTATDLPSLKTFYTEHFGFSVTFDGKGYLGLKSAKSPGLEMGFMLPCSENGPVFNGQGLILCMEVDDVDGEYERLIKEGVASKAPPTDNPWGDRSFMVTDPAGVTLYILQPIPPTAEYKAFIKE